MKQQKLQLKSYVGKVFHIDNLRDLLRDYYVDNPDRSWQVLDDPDFTVEGALAFVEELDDNEVVELVCKLLILGKIALGN